MSYIFFDCYALKTLPDISRWDTSNVSNMSFMFCCCINLTVLPDISNWNISKTNDISFMFYNCSKLDLTNIPNWNIENINIKEHFLPNSIKNLDNSNFTIYIRSYFSKDIFKFNCCSNMLFIDFYSRLNNIIREKCKSKYNINKYDLISNGYIINKKHCFFEKISSVFKNDINEIQIIPSFKGG